MFTKYKLYKPILSKVENHYKDVFIPLMPEYLLDILMEAYCKNQAWYYLEQKEFDLFRSNFIFE